MGNKGERRSGGWEDRRKWGPVVGFVTFFPFPKRREKRNRREWVAKRERDKCVLIDAVSRWELDSERFFSQEPRELRFIWPGAAQTRAFLSFESDSVTGRFSHWKKKRGIFFWQIEMSSFDQTRDLSSTVSKQYLGNQYRLLERERENKARRSRQDRAYG